MIKITVKNIKEEMARIKSEVFKEVDNSLKNSANKMLSELSEATPVLTGFARDSWSTQKVAPTVFVVTNTASYIERLNAGSSKQAPAFFVEKIALKYGRPLGAIVNIKSDPETN